MTTGSGNSLPSNRSVPTFFEQVSFGSQPDLSFPKSARPGGYTLTQRSRSVVSLSGAHSPSSQSIRHARNGSSARSRSFSRPFSAQVQPVRPAPIHAGHGRQRSLPGPQGPPRALSIDNISPIKRYPKYYTNNQGRAPGNCWWCSTVYIRV